MNPNRKFEGALENRNSSLGPTAHQKPNTGSLGVARGLKASFPNAMCATQAHGLRPFSQGENACAGLPQACAARAAATSVHAVRYPWGRRLQSRDRSETSCRQSRRKATRRRIYKYSRICRYTRKRLPRREPCVYAHVLEGAIGEVT